MINAIIAWFYAGLSKHRETDCNRRCLCDHHGIYHRQNRFGPLIGKCRTEPKEGYVCACQGFVAIEKEQ